MSTRAVYTFIDVRGTFHIYKHCDGYPEGAVGFIKAAFEIGSPRANDLAISFIVANKKLNNPYFGSELTSHYDQHVDLEYRYEISSKDEEEAIFEVKKRNFIISAFERTSSFSEDPTYGLIFSGSLNEFEKFARKICTD